MWYGRAMRTTFAIAACLALLGCDPAPCEKGWTLLDKTVLPSGIEQMPDRLTEISGSSSLYRKKVVMVFTCPDGRYRIETESNP